jgi:S1-C subfamily serine protease
MGARQDDQKCLMCLGLAYYAGEGVRQNMSEAVRLWRRAAEQGLAAAEEMMGTVYSEGIEVAVNEEEAYLWLKLAANQGEETARKAAARMAEKLTKSQMARARERIAAFKPRGPAAMVAANLPAPAPPPLPAVADRPHTAGPPAKPKHEAADDGVICGTGFFITGSGYVVTNYHVIGLGRTLHILEGKDKVWQAKLVAHDKRADLAVLKVDTAEHACLPVITSKTVKLGATVATVGFPNPDVQGVAPKVAKGEIAALSGVMDDPDRFQISVPLQPGNSGGSLVDARGNVVGIVCGILDQEVALATSGTLANSVAYAVKGSLLLDLLTTLPGISKQLPAPITAAREFEDVISDVERATVLIIAE